MKKIDEISEENSSPLHCAILGICFTIALGFLVFTLKPFDAIQYLNNTDNVFEIISIIPIMLLLLVVHELIHVGLFILFGNGKAKIRVSINKKYRAIVVKQINKEVFYNKKETILILISPLLTLSIVLFLLMFVVNMPLLLCSNLIINALGSSIDLYISVKLLVKHDKDILVNYDSHKTMMNKSSVGDFFIVLTIVIICGIIVL